MHATGIYTGAEYCGWMVDTREVQAQLRKLWTDQGFNPTTLAARSGVDRATVYRIANLDTPYLPTLTKLLQLLDALRVQPATFFSMIRDGDLPRHARSARSPLPTEGGSIDGIPAPSERDRISDIEAERDRLKTALGQIHHVALQLIEIAAVSGQGHTSTARPPGRRGGHRKTS